MPSLIQRALIRCSVVVVLGLFQASFIVGIQNARAEDMSASIATILSQILHNNDAQNARAVYFENFHSKENTFRSSSTRSLLSLYQAIPYAQFFSADQSATGLRRCDFVAPRAYLYNVRESVPSVYFSKLSKKAHLAANLMRDELGQLLALKNNSSSVLDNDECEHLRKLESGIDSAGSVSIDIYFIEEARANCEENRIRIIDAATAIKLRSGNPVDTTTSCVFIVNNDALMVKRPESVSFPHISSVILGGQLRLGGEGPSFVTSNILRNELQNRSCFSLSYFENGRLANSAIFIWLPKDNLLSDDAASQCVSDALAFKHYATEERRKIFYSLQLAGYGRVVTNPDNKEIVADFKERLQKILPTHHEP